MKHVDLLQLLPCPHCDGSAAKYREMELHKVICTNALCIAHEGRGYDTGEEAVDAWNARAESIQSLKHRICELERRIGYGPPLRHGWVLPDLGMCACGKPRQATAHLEPIDGWMLTAMCEDWCTDDDVLDWPFGDDEVASAEDFERIGFVIID